MATGYTIKNQNGDILMETVSGTERAAKINWLHAYAGFPIYNHYTDETIEEMWIKWSPQFKVSLVKVQVTEFPE